MLKDLNPRIFLEYRRETVEASYEEAELAAFVTKLGWTPKLRTAGFDSKDIERIGKQLDIKAGVNWKYRAANFKIVIGKKGQILTPYYAFLLFVGERHNWDIAQLARFFGRRDLTKAMHVLKELIPFIQIPGIGDKHLPEAKIDEKKRASLHAFSWESVQDLAKRLREEGLLKEIDLKGKKEILLKNEEKRRQEARAKSEAEKQAQEMEWRKQVLDKKLRSFLKEQRTRNKDRSYGIDAINLARGTEEEKEKVRKKYSWKIKEFKKDRKWE